MNLGDELGSFLEYQREGLASLMLPPAQVSQQGYRQARPFSPFSRVLREPLHSPTGTQDPTAPPFPVGRHRALTGLLGKDALRWVHPLFPPPGSRQGGGPRRLRVPGTKSPGPAPSAAPRLVFLACGTALREKGGHP